MKSDLVVGFFAASVAYALLFVLAYKFVKNIRRSTRRRADDAAATGSSATSAASDNYDVFLSFSGKDTRKTFVDHLYNGLVDAGIRVFRDDNELREGEKIGSSLLQAIKNSKISIAILSRNYASSKWCLQELAEMIECMKTVGQVVLPIFYRVEPAHVRYQKGSFGETFSRLSGKYVEEDVAKWKQALQEVASLKGWESENTAHGHEGELVKKVVRKVYSELKKAFLLVVTEQLVGIDNAMEDILRLLNDNFSATQTIGIYGMGGIGKTTLAKVVYNKLYNKFQYHSFIADIRESSKREGISYLLNQLIFDILKINDQVSHTDEGIRIMESRFKCKKVLILLDDVDHIDQLKALVGKHDWFKMGSKIITTTRIRSVLDEAGVDCKYELKEIPEDKSLILFSRHAFLRDSPPCEFEPLSRAIVSTTGGLPLALEVIGSSLCGRNQAFWQDALKKLQKVPHKKVREKLRISYDILEYEEKQIFLDTACFFIGFDLRIVSCMWDACNYHPSMGLETLSFMSLIKIGDDGELKMHDQLRDLGREIVREEDYDVPMNRSRLWVEEALEVLEETKGNQKPRVQALWLGHCSQRNFTTEQFETLPTLRLFRVDDAKLIGDSKGLLPKLRWLSWRGCPAFRAASFHMEKLVMLDLSKSDVSEFWEGWSYLKMVKLLKVLILADCHYLKVTPDLLAFQNLEILILNRCYNLEEIHPSIGKVKGLVFLNLQGCCKLKQLPQEMGELKGLKELSISRTGIKKLPPCIGHLKKLEVINADGCELLIGFPDSISHLVNLLTLNLQKCMSLRELPESIGSLMNLQSLSLSMSRSLFHIPNSIGKLEQLTKLELSSSGIRELPESIGDLKNLKILDISKNERLRNLPSAICKLGKLEVLNAKGCSSLGGEVPIDGLSSLRVLQLGGTCVSGFLGEFDKLSRLEKLDLCFCEMLRSLPQSINKLPSLQHLDLTYCEELQLLPELPACLTVLGVTCQHQTLPQLSHLIHLNELTFEGCRLLESMPELPSGLLVLRVHHCDELKEITSLSSLESLSELDLESCRELTEIKGLEALKSLIKLTVSKCRNLANLDGLEHLESLRSLCLSEFSESDAPLLNYDGFQVQGLHKFKNLEELQIWNCQSQDLWQFTDRHQLSLNECHNLVKIKGLERLKKLKKLHMVWRRYIEPLKYFPCSDQKYSDFSWSWELCDVQGPASENLCFDSQP